MVGGLGQLNHSSLNPPTVNLTELTALVRALQHRTNPLSGEIVADDSCLARPRVQGQLDVLMAELAAMAAPDAGAPVNAMEVGHLCEQLRGLGYQPTPEQLEKVFLGSRSIADPRLRGLADYRRYRSVLTRPELRAKLAVHGELIASHRDEAAPPPPTRAKVSKPWRGVDFFTTEVFDKLSEEKATELYREVTALGLRKSNDRLPAYMAKARINLPRAFEPWSREERALLIEAMCYTNAGEKLASIFGRSVKSVTEEGQRLIYGSQQRHEAA